MNLRRNQNLCVNPQTAYVIKYCAEIYAQKQGTAIHLKLIVALFICPIDFFVAKMQDFYIFFV
jgi:hypothetical protein